MLSSILACATSAASFRAFRSTAHERKALRRSSSGLRHLLTLEWHLATWRRSRKPAGFREIRPVDDRKSRQITHFEPFLRAPQLVSKGDWLERSLNRHQVASAGAGSFKGGALGGSCATLTTLQSYNTCLKDHLIQVFNYT